MKCLKELITFIRDVIRPVAKGPVEPTMPLRSRWKTYELDNGDTLLVMEWEEDNNVR